MPPKAKGAKKKTGYQMPEKFDEGFVIKDIFKINWTIGKPIGQGGFGLIYLANKQESKIKNSDDAQYVVKIEPKDNGPLFCESHFYVNSAKEDDLKVFIRANNLKHLAMPKYISSGLCTYNDKEYRFLVMDRYAKDLQSFINQTPSHQINEIGVLCLMRQILYALEYIHQKGYSHGDIKGANIMLKNDNESYLVDYGLANRFKRDDTHQKYHIKPERKHNGTIEYTSRDAHEGAQTYRRSDLEILGYCAIHWLSGTLPWIDLIKNADHVYQSKDKNMKNIKEFLNNSFKSVNNVSDCVKSFMEFYLNEVKKLEYDSEPPYSIIQSKLTDTLNALGHKPNSGDNFRLFSVSKSLPKTSQKKNEIVEVAAANGNDSDTDNDVPNGFINGAHGTSKKKRVAKGKVVEPSDEDSEQEDDDQNEKEQELFQKVKPTPKSKQTKKSANPRSTKKTSSKKKDNAQSDNDQDSECETKEKKTRIKKNSNNNGLKIDDLSDIEDPSDDELDTKEHANKKSRNVFQSTCIDQSAMDLNKKNVKKLIENDPIEARSPRNVTKPSTPVRRNLRGKTPEPDENIIMVTTGSGSKKATNGRTNNGRLNKNKIESDNESDEQDEHQRNTGINKLPTTPGIKTSNLLNGVNNPSTTTTPKVTEKLNGAQLEMFNKKKNTNRLIETPTRSPLALANLDKDNGFILVKKRKNVCKKDVCTQTDQSYLQTHVFKS